jgi:isoleucyl-tRNA synthetase
LERFIIPTHFFALYANIDNFAYKEEDIEYIKRPELDRWILSELNSLIKETDEAYGAFEPTRAGRAIAKFVDEHLSNWFVRLSRRRFWKGDYSEDKISAYQTLYTCLETVALLSSPIAPFYSERLFLDLNKVSGKRKEESIHLCIMPTADAKKIDKDLEERMEMAQQYSSMVLSLRKKEQIRVRQPLNKIMIPVLNQHFKEQIDKITDLILSEVNVKTLEFMTEDTGMLVKKIKANFKTLGPRYGKLMKQIAGAIAQFEQHDIKKLETEGAYHLDIDGESVLIELADVEISTGDIPGWLIASQGSLTVALDVTITEELRQEGIARDIVNKIQGIRKESGLDVTDQINIKIEKHAETEHAINNNISYICSETLAKDLKLMDSDLSEGELVDLSDSLSVKVKVEKVS